MFNYTGNDQSQELELEYSKELEEQYDKYFELMSIAEQKSTYSFINAVLMDSKEIVLDQPELTEYGVHLLSIILLDAKSVATLHLSSLSSNLSKRILIKSYSKINNNHIANKS